jgi:peroxiredoxin
LQLALPKIKELGATVVAISPETVDRALSTAQKSELSFEVLSDHGNRVAKQFGLVFQLPEDLRTVYESFKMDLKAANADDTFELPLTATYIIYTDRKIRKAFLDTDYTKRWDPEEIVSALSDMAQDS